MENKNTHITIGYDPATEGSVQIVKWKNNIPEVIYPKKEISYKTFMDLTLESVYKSMGMKPHKRWPRKQKKRRKKGIANSLARKAILQYEAEYKPLREIIADAWKQKIEDQLHEFNRINGI